MGSTTSTITIPGRAVFRAHAIESVAIHVPRSPFVDEQTGVLCACVLIVETARCLHKFPIETFDEAAALVSAAGLTLLCMAPSDGASRSRPEGASEGASKERHLEAV